jgi:hypothetical protein
MTEPHNWMQKHRLALRTILDFFLCFFVHFFLFCNKLYKRLLIYLLVLIIENNLAKLPFFVGGCCSDICSYRVVLHNPGILLRLEAQGIKENQLHIISVVTELVHTQIRIFSGIKQTLNTIKQMEKRQHV